MESLPGLMPNLLSVEGLAEDWPVYGLQGAICETHQEGVGARKTLHSNELKSILGFFNRLNPTMLGIESEYAYASLEHLGRNFSYNRIITNSLRQIQTSVGLKLA